MAKVPIAVAYGDGIGPEIMKSCLRILEAAGAELDIREIEVGEKVYREGYSAGIKPEVYRFRKLQSSPPLFPANFW